MTFRRRVRTAATVLVPLLAAAVWAAVYERAPRVEHFVWIPLTFRAGLAPSDPPCVPWVPPASVELAVDQARALAWPLLPCAALLLVGLGVGVTSALRRRGRLPRRLRRVPVRAGVLALLLGVAAGSALAASEFVVVRELGYWEHWGSADRGSTPWGALGAAGAGLVLALIGLGASALLELARRIRGDDT